MGLLHAMYPKALPRHFRLFQQWSREFDDLEKKKIVSSEAAGAFKQYLDVSRKPIIPARELEAIKREFANLDSERLGSLEFDVIARYIGDTTNSIAAKFDVDFDDHVSLPEFCRMMCPPQYRLPEMDGIGRRLFGTLLESITKESHEKWTRSSASFEHPRTSSDVMEVSQFQAMHEPVPDSVWSQWQDVFHELDSDGDDVVHLSDLLVAGFMSEPVCRYITGYLDPDLEDRFTLDTFNAEMLRAHGFRKKIAFDGKTPYAGKHIELP